VAEEHEVQVYGVVLIKPGSIPKTSSGKIQRRACRADFLTGNLEVRGNSMDSSDSAADENSLSRETPGNTSRTPTTTRGFLQQQVQVLKLSQSK